MRKQTFFGLDKNSFLGYILLGWVAFAVIYIVVSFFADTSFLIYLGGIVWLALIVYIYVKSKKTQ